MVKVPWRCSQSHKVYNPHHGRNLTNFFLFYSWYLEFWVGRVWHTLIICIAEPKSGSQEVGTWSNSDLMESQMSRGEGEMDSHFWKHFWVILLNSSFELLLLRIMVTSFLAFFLNEEDYSMSFLNWILSEVTFEEFWPFLEWIGTQWRFWAGVVVELSGESRRQYPE